MAEPTDAQIDAALARGEAARLSEPRAASARYDRQLGRVVVELTNGCTFAFPPRLRRAPLPWSHRSDIESAKRP